MSALLTLLAPIALAASDATAAPLPTALTLEPTAPVFGAPLPAEYLAAFTQDDEDEIPESGWHGAVNFGASYATGNTENTKLTATAIATNEVYEGEALDHRWTASAYWAFGSDRNSAPSVFERRWGALVKYDHYLSDRMYAYGTASVDHDFASGLDLRWQAGAGLGYTFVDKEHYKVSGEAGLSYVDEDYVVNIADTDYLAARIAYNVWWQINDNWSFTQLAEAFPSIEGDDDVYARVNTSLAGQLTENMTAGLNWLLFYDNTPIPGADRLDHILSATIGWAF